LKLIQHICFSERYAGPQYILKQLSLNIAGRTNWD